ncbi:NAD(P)H-dependent oxidoreductase [Youngiibacter multivorans]|uniref:NAD(P)H-dependent FMN reductase n=1 Tax=Youngiibacter multivorans TaxID=937251 RepID=A0ABS4G5M4_9CLOT|nr:NAD(P)H-dependent oxidoreductase [Youngiibacter multivorans]MBP1919867.1 NAD(P)H-dependent FMN reductase [Youngiibacter multivorans]
MKNIVLINGSPKVGEPSTSRHLIDIASPHFNGVQTNRIIIDVQKSMENHTTQSDFEAILNADAVIIAFPLYMFGLPGMLIKYLEDLQTFYIQKGMPEKGTKVYAIVNSGYPEPEVNLEAVRVIRSFCQHINAHFRFGVLVGGGPLLLSQGNSSATKKPLNSLNDAFTAISEDIGRSDFQNIDNFIIPISFPRRLYLFMGGRAWLPMAKKNGLKKADLYRRPYQA